MKQNKISKPYLNPMKKFNLENKYKDETEIQQLRNEKSHIKEHEYQIKVSRINKGKLTKSKNESKDKTTKTKCTSKENTKNKNLSKEKLSRKRKVFSKEKLSEKKNISKQKDENAKFDEERIKKELKEKEKEKQDKIKKLNSFYNNNQNKIIINKLGVDIFTYNKILEVKLIPSNFLFRHKLVPEIRTKMVNWQYFTMRTGLLNPHSSPSCFRHRFSCWLLMGGRARSLLKRFCAYLSRMAFA